MLQFKVDAERCSQCGLCVQDCPFGAMAMEEYPVIPDENACLRCQHCLAVCPTAAISILGKDPDQSLPLKDNLPSAEKMAVLIRGRRSVRRYKNESLDPAVLRELLETTWHAPTGVNSQKVLLTVTETMETTRALRDAVYDGLAVVVPQGSLPDNMIGEYLTKAHHLWKEKQADIIFRGAPHCVFASAPVSWGGGMADMHISLSYLELMAQTMGIGTLWNGMLKWAVGTVFPDLRQRLGIPDDHDLGCAMVLGRPGVKYHRTVQRSPANLNRVVW